jgi:hypothetical protein
MPSSSFAVRMSIMPPSSTTPITGLSFASRPIAAAGSATTPAAHE